MKHQKQQREKLQALIRDLERNLAEGKSQMAALEETHKRLQESENWPMKIAGWKIGDCSLKARQSIISSGRDQD